MARTKTTFAVAALSLFACISYGQSVLHDVIYAKEGGAAFTMDVFKPAKPTGQAVMFLVSGGWFSNHKDINPQIAKVLNDKGFTVFEVVHGSQPRYVIPDIVRQLQRAVRFIRYNASEYEIQRNEIGVTGASSGGHLSLMIAALGGPGDPAAMDPVDRTGSELNAVVDFFGPTDFLNWGDTSKLPVNDSKLAMFMPAFGLKPEWFKDKDKYKDNIEALARDLSPIYKVTPKFPPILIVHGDKDPLVPIQQSNLLDAALEKNHVKHKLLVVPGGAHDAKTYLGGLSAALDWFATNLK